MESENELQEKIRELYEKLETDPILEKEYLKDEKQFLQNNGFDPEQVKDVIENIAFTEKSTYSSGGDIYKRKITSVDAKTILTNIDECKWNSKTSKMLLVANQLKLRI